MKWTSSIATQYFFCAHSAVIMPISMPSLPHLGASSMLCLLVILVTLWDNSAPPHGTPERRQSKFVCCFLCACHIWGEVIWSPERASLATQKPQPAQHSIQLSKGKRPMVGLLVKQHHRRRILQTTQPWLSTAWPRHRAPVLFSMAVSAARASLVWCSHLIQVATCCAL